MLEIGVQLVVLAVVLAVMFVLLQNAFAPRFQFMIQVKQGNARITKGKAPVEFLDNVREICRESGISEGWVGGVKRGKSIALRFSRHFPPQCQQRLRNVWFCP